MVEELRSSEKKSVVDLYREFTDMGRGTMLKLMKYEFRKSASSKLILLVLTAVLNWHFLGAYFLKDII